MMPTLASCAASTSPPAAIRRRWQRSDFQRSRHASLCEQFSPSPISKVDVRCRCNRVNPGCKAADRHAEAVDRPSIIAFGRSRRGSRAAPAHRRTASSCWPIATMVRGPREPPSGTLQMLGSALNWRQLRARGHAREGIDARPTAARPPAPDGSLMKRITTLLSLIAAALRYSGHLVSVIDEPLAQSRKPERPGANRAWWRWWARSSARRSRARPARAGTAGSAPEFFMLITTVSLSGAVICCDALEQALVLVGAGRLPPARS